MFFLGNTRAEPERHREGEHALHAKALKRGPCTSPAVDSLSRVSNRIHHARLLKEKMSLAACEVVGLVNQQDVSWRQIRRVQV